MITRWIALAALAALVTACANAPGRSVAADTEGAMVAAQLGFHGPVHRSPTLKPGP